MSDQTNAAMGTKEQLFTELRRIKQESGFSYGQLADRTHYSRSSWERFLNGKQLPSKVAVEQFASATGADPDPLLALLAAVERPPAGETAATAEAQVPEPEPGHFGGPAPATTPAPVAAGVDPVAGPPGVLRRAARWIPGPPVRRPAVERASSWRRRFGVVGYLASGAAMGAVATVLTMGTGAGSAAHGVSASDGGGQASGVGGAQVVHAAGKVDVRCSGDTCLRRDPQAMDCQWDASTAHDTWLRGMHIELRYSPACHAVWGRIENGAVGDVVKIRDRTGMEQEATIRTDRDTYTRMLAVTDDAPAASVAVCGEIPSQKQLECSPSAKVEP
ncbi:helix-turn-helix domain-containing protein [Streptomyces sp. NPDC059070]|uniref:helix-turn-helix domain-containing protein n=1 Tax=Streptomyces sp. NPDC059070 TaxID=3346713 RepID=UPI0036792C9D